MTGAAGFLLQIAVGFLEVRLMQVEGKTVFSGQRSDELGVCYGSRGTDSMLDMDEGEMEIPARRKVMEHMEEEDGIGATGDGDSDALAWVEHFELSGVGEEAVEHYAYLMA